MLSAYTELIAIIGKPARPMPTVHAYNCFFETYKVPLACMAFEPTTASAAVQAMRHLGFRGMAVTMPFKSEALAAADWHSKGAERVGACNTLYWTDDRIAAENTDACAIELILARLPQSDVARAVVLGSGGAARAVVSVLDSAGYEVVILARNPTTRDAITARFPKVVLATGDVSAAVAQPYNLLINATPVGSGASGLPVPKESLPIGGTVVDLVFQPSETALVREARAVGCGAITGLTVLALQAIEQLRLWSGHIPRETDLMTWLEETLHVDEWREG